MKIKNVLISFLGLSLIGALAYRVNMHAGFVFDDYKVIILNPAIRHLTDIVSIWKHDPTRFLPALTFALNYRIAGFEVFSYHLFNLILHVLGGFCVYWLVVLLMKAPALKLEDREDSQIWPFLAALIFIIHPVQTSTVSYIVQRSTIMAGIFYLLAMIGYLKWRLYPGRLSFYSGFAAALASSFCKPSVITLPLALVLLEVFFLKGVEKKRKTGWGIAAFLAAVMIVPGLLALLKEISPSIGTFVSITRQTPFVSRWGYLTTQFNVLVYYIGLLFFPISQNLDYGFPFTKGLLAWPTFFSFAVLWYLLYMAYRCRRGRMFSFVVLWFFVTLLPESSIFPLEDALFEHRLYLPLAGFALALSYAVVFKISWKPARLSASMALTLFLAFLTVSRNTVWSDPEALMKDNIAKSPHHLRPRFNLSSHYIREGNLDKARKVIEEAAAIAPWHPDNYFKIAYIYELQGQSELAMIYYRKAIDLDPEHARGEYYLRLAQFNIGRQRWDKAEPLLEEALKRSPKSDVIHTEMGNINNLQGDSKRAFEHYQEAVELNPYNENALNGLATIYVLRGDYDQGVEIYERLIRLAPGMELAYVNLAKVYFLKKDWEKSKEIFNKALKIGVDDPEILVRLAQININLKNYFEAQDQMATAIRTYRKRGLNEVADQLQQQYFAKGLPPES
ncbi:MAG: tetratricopeptide repeat protein [Candidatus Omnitrophota bacterium]